MRLSLRFVLPLLLVLAAVAYGVTQLAEGLMLRWFVRDLDARSALIARTLEDPLPELILAGQRGRVVDLFDRMVRDERLYAVGFCDPGHKLAHRSVTFPASVSCLQLEDKPGPGRVLRLPQGSLHAAVNPVRDPAGHSLGNLVLLHDMSFIERRTEDTRRYLFYLFVALGGMISLMTVAIAQISWWGWVRGLRAMLSGDWLLKATASPGPPELQPVVKDLRALVSDLRRDRRSHDESQVSWNPDALRTILREDLRGDEILVVSNRAPYLHNRRDGVVQVQRPASGLVTALEPVMVACSGTWIAHGSGSADKEVVDARDHIAVPPPQPAYDVRLVWLSPEQENGYYYGFSNEGLWPLCHIAHTRPVFRPADWERYVEVNHKFAAAVSEEASTPDPVVMVQDYHFALLPAMIHRQLPNATIIAFWHIPWPNPEAFGICPWAEQILAGMLGSSILGFHTRYHCNNFLDTVDRFLEARVDRETNIVSYQSSRTAVKRYPISIEWPPSNLTGLPSVEACRSQVRERQGLGPDAKIVLGVDRLDYTKGILERFLAIERLLELEPGWVGRVVLLQIGAPSRSRIPEYRDFAQRVEAQAERINARFGRDGYKPILLRLEHVDAWEVYTHYRAADVCMVSSLHDGMNLVAKEFPAARDDEQGVLILSEFTGASRELVEALIINPYDLDQSAAALRVALSMPAREQRDRMRGMRGLIQEFNVYRWAGRMLLDAAEMRRRTRVLGAGGVGAPRERARPREFAL